MRSLANLPTSLLALLSALALPCVRGQGSLEIEITTPVTCTRPTAAGDVISVHYRGTLLLTGAVFDESYKRGQPITFTLGTGQVIEGWDQGLLKMCPGERRTLTIPPDMAYGERGRPPMIPPSSTLVFETELVDIVGVEQKEIHFLTSASATATFAPAASMFSTSLPASSVYSSSYYAASVYPSSSLATVETSTTTEQMFSIETSPNRPPLPGSDELEDDISDTLAGKPLVPPNPPVSTLVQEGECHLLGPFALIIQGALGAVAILSLVVKRWRETPKRPWKIFFFDVSKQVLGSCLTHVLNLAMSMLSSVDMMNSAKSAAIAATTQSGSSAGTSAAGDGGGKSMPNPCSFYILNLGIDTTLGIPVLYLLLRVLHVAFTYTPLARPRESIKSGHYGTPPKTTWWLKQSLIYFIGLCGMKAFVFFLFRILPWLPWVGDWALRWTEGNEALQIAFAMFVFPLAMNAVQYWVIDSFIMEKQGKNESGGSYERVQGEDDDVDGLDDEGRVDGEGIVGREEVHTKNGESLTPVPVYRDRGESSRSVSPQAGANDGDAEVDVEHDARKRR